MIITDKFGTIHHNSSGVDYKSLTFTPQFFRRIENILNANFKAIHLPVDTYV